MLEAVRKLCLHHVHRMPVVDPESGNLLYMLTHKRLLSYLYNFVSLSVNLRIFLRRKTQCGSVAEWLGHWTCNQ